MFRLPRHPAIWFAAFLGWFAALWFCSSLPGSAQPMPVPHLDKLLHFSYYLGGGLLFAGCHFRLQPAQPAWGRILGAALKPGAPSKFQLQRRDAQIALDVTPGVRPKPRRPAQ